MCEVLFSLYGRDTRAAQLLSMLLSMWWFIAISFTGMQIVQFELPPDIATDWVNVATLFLLSTLTAALSFTADGRPRQILKAFALLLGALDQAILANAYLTEYPPLDMMLCVSAVLVFYFLGAVLYIFKCEGLDGMGVQH